MKTLLVTDLHLTDKPKDAYRFGIFDFLVEQRAKHDCSQILILGDLTDLKDKHSSKLVNLIVEGLKKLTYSVQVNILMGNHDYYADPTNPFFKFLSNMHNIKFLTVPTVIGRHFYVPHIKAEADWDALKPDKQVDYAFIHQTVTGAISESGRRLDGFSLKPLKRLNCPVFAGDVHSPHTIGPVTYVGPPYHIRFGDNFEPRCLILNEKTGDTKEIYFDCPRKWTLDISEVEAIASDKRLRRGDQVRVRLSLTREELVEWPVFKGRIVQVLQDLGLDSFGIELTVSKPAKAKLKEDQDEAVTRQQLSPLEVLGSYCKQEKLPGAFRKAGLKLLKGN